MRVIVEFFGTARDLVGANEVNLEMARGATLREMVAALAEEFPRLVGPIIKTGATGLVAPYMFNIDGRQTVSDLGYCPQDGQRIVLLLACAGG